MAMNLDGGADYFIRNLVQRTCLRDLRF